MDSSSRNSCISLFPSHLPFLLLTCGGLIAMTTCKLWPSSFAIVWWLSPQAGIRMMGKSTIPRGFIHCKAVRHLPICVYRVLKKKQTVMEQWAQQQPLSKILKYKEKAFAETSNDTVESSMLVMSRCLFCNVVLCVKKSTSEKKNCPRIIAILVGFATHALKKKKRSEIPVPLHHWCGLNYQPVVLKADKRYFISRLFNQILARKPHVDFLFHRVCRLLLLSEAAEVFRPSRWLLVPLSSRHKPNLKQSGTSYRLSKQPTLSRRVLCCLFKGFL